MKNSNKKCTIIVSDSLGNKLFSVSGKLEINENNKLVNLAFSLANNRLFCPIRVTLLEDK